MHDIKLIRSNPDAFDAHLARRGLAPQAQALLLLDEARRRAQTQLQELLSCRNALARQVGEAKRKGEAVDAIMAESKAANDAIAILEASLSERDALETQLEALPNLPAGDVPAGLDEHSNQEVRRWGAPPTFAFAPAAHDTLGAALGMMDFESAAALSGARFVVLKGPLARMERALASFFLDRNTAAGYTEVVPPFLVRDAAVYGTGQLPKFGEDLFRTTNGFWLIPTAEVPLTNLVADRIIDAQTLPLRMTAYTPCFRSEAGAAGKDTRGMIRQHQFSKVELVSVTAPEHAEAEHERMTAQAESLLQALGLPYRVMVLCAGDMGFSAEKTYDIEVWMSGQNAYREISSCSRCGAFQARRMKARMRVAGAKETQPVHTLNGSGLPIGRTIVAMLEHYQQADGTVLIPEVLRPYMGGLERLTPMV